MKNLFFILALPFVCSVYCMEFEQEPGVYKSIHDEHRSDFLSLLELGAMKGRDSSASAQGNESLDVGVAESLVPYLKDFMGWSTLEETEVESKCKEASVQKLLAARMTFLSNFVEASWSGDKKKLAAVLVSFCDEKI